MSCCVMYYSLTLLKQFLSLKDTPEAIAQQLILKSCEIEEVIHRTLPKELVIWRVTDVAPHPNADKLVVCQLDCGEHGTYQICTWATNIAKDMLVPVALPGCYLPAIDLHISPRKMRWEESNGMICAKEELGIKEDLDQHWIRNLSEDFESCTVWARMCDEFPWMENTILDVDNKTLTHRPDLTGHFGLSTELYAIYKTHFPSKIWLHTVSSYYHKLSDKNIFNLLAHGKQSNKKITSSCEWLRSYLLLDLKDVRIQKSPFFMRLQLADLWLQSKNNWVDFSNLFMYITGQPIHFFDANKIAWDISVRYASAWESFVDLFEKKHSLTTQDVVIADARWIIALAGIVWGKDSWIDEHTTHIIAEIANFDPIVVRQTAKRLWYRTDASMRYEKNINPTFSLQMFELFLDMCKHYSLWYTYAWSSDWYNETTRQRLMTPQTIEVNLIKAQQLIFGGIEEGFVQKAHLILTSLWFAINTSDNDNIDEQTTTITVTPPAWRSYTDMTIAEDIIEEIARVYGFENIATRSLYSHISYVPLDTKVSVHRTIEQTLVDGCHMDHVETYPWAEDTYYETFGTPTDTLLQLENAMTPETSYLRDSLIYNLLHHVRKNHKFFDTMSLFDIGKVRTQTNNSDTTAHTTIKTWERVQCGILLYRKTQQSTKTSRQEDTFLEMKQHIERIHRALWLTNTTIHLSSNSYFHPTKQWTISVHADNKDIAIRDIWQIHPHILHASKIDTQSEVVFASLDMTAVQNIIDSRNKASETKSLTTYTTLQDQIVRRDLSFVIDKNQTFDTILDTVSTIKEIHDIQIFDLYAWVWVPDGKKSISFSFAISWDGNLTTDHINRIMDIVINKVNTIWWSLRQ